MTNESHMRSGKKVLSKNSSGRGAFSVDKKDNNAHIGKDQKRRSDGKY